MLYQHDPPVTLTSRSWVIDFDRFGGKAQVRRATLSCDSSYCYCKTCHLYKKFMLIHKQIIKVFVENLQKKVSLCRRCVAHFIKTGNGYSKSAKPSSDSDRAKMLEFILIKSKQTKSLHLTQKNHIFRRMILFLAHLSRRLTGELIVYPCSGVRPSVVRRLSVVHPSSTIFKDLLL